MGVVLIIVLISAIVMLYTLYNEKLYCRIHMNKQWKQWQYLQKHVDDIQFDEVLYDYKEDELVYYFTYENDNNKLFDESDYYIALWSKKKECAVFMEGGGKCILATFDKYNNGIMTKLLFDKLSNESNKTNISHSFLKKKLLERKNFLKREYNNVNRIKQLLSEAINKQDKKSIQELSMLLNDYRKLITDNESDVRHMKSSIKNTQRNFTKSYKQKN